MGALITYRDHVVHLTEGMEDFDGFVPGSQSTRAVQTKS